MDAGGGMESAARIPTCCASTCPRSPASPFHFKDESSHPTGSLKHRLACSLFLHPLCHGRLREGRAVVDASSGSTAIPEAWFARRLGLPFVAVMPACTAQPTIAAVQALRGSCDLVDDPAEVHARAAWLPEDLFGQRYGDSSGTNLVACLRSAAAMRQHGELGSIGSLLCDRGERYQRTLFAPSWLRARGLDPAPVRRRLAASPR